MPVDPEFWRNRDTGTNRYSSPPVGEDITLHSVWGVEFYTSAHMAQLNEALARIRATQFGGITPSADLLEWFNELPRFQFRGEWLNFGVLVPDETSEIRGIERFVVNLPQGFDYALMSINEISPSLAAVSVCFVCSDETARAVQHALKQDRTTCSRRAGQDITIVEPPEQKADAVREFRACMAESVASWYSEELPGLYSSGLLGGDFPICEFTTTEAAWPFATREENGWHDLYLNLADLDHDTETWASTDTPGLRFRSRANAPRHAILASRNAELSAAMNMPGRVDKVSRVNFVNASIKDLVLVWSLVMLLEGHTAAVREFRSQRLSGIERGNRLIDSLADLEDVVLRGTAISELVTDISDLMRHKRAVNRGVPRFTPLDKSGPNRFRTLEAHFRRTIRTQAKSLQRLEADTRAHATQLGGLVSARENLRLQRRIGWLAAATALLAVVNLVAFIAQSCGSQ